MTKRNLKKYIIIGTVLIIAAALAFYILNWIYRDSQTTIINCAGSRGNLYSYDGEYYIIQKTGACRSLQSRLPCAQSFL